MDYSKAFRVIRATFGLRQAELARRLRIGASQLSLIEAGRRQPSLKTLEDFAQAFQIPKALIMVWRLNPATWKVKATVTLTTWLEPFSVC